MKTNIVKLILDTLILVATLWCVFTAPALPSFIWSCLVTTSFVMQLCAGLKKKKTKLDAEAAKNIIEEAFKGYECDVNIEVK